MESSLEKILRLAQVKSFERKSPRGRLERVRSFMRGIENEKLPSEEDAMRGKPVPGSGNWAFGRNEASIKAHNTASATAKATWSRDDAEDIVGKIGKANGDQQPDWTEKSQKDWPQKSDWALGQATHHVRGGNFKEAASWVDRLADDHPSEKAASKLRSISAKLRSSS